MGRVRRYKKIKSIDPFSKKKKEEIDTIHDEPPTSSTSSNEKKKKNRNLLFNLRKDAKETIVVLPNTVNYFSFNFDLLFVVFCCF